MENSGRRQAGPLSVAVVGAEGAERRCGIGEHPGLKSNRSSRYLRAIPGDGGTPLGFHAVFLQTELDLPRITGGEGDKSGQYGLAGR